MAYKNRNQCFIVLRQVEDTRQAEAFQRAMQMGKAPPKQLQTSFGVRPDMGPMDVHDLKYMKEVDLLPLMVRGRDQVIDLDGRSKNMVLHVAVSSPVFCLNECGADETRVTVEGIRAARLHPPGRRTRRPVAHARRAGH